MTKLDWSFSIAALRDETGLERLAGIIDFTAVPTGATGVSPPSGQSRKAFGQLTGPISLRLQWLR